MLKNLFSGKIARLRFFGSLVLSLVIFIAIIFGGAVMASSLLKGTLSYGGTIVVYSLVLLLVIGMMLFIFSLYAKRCHDLGLSGYYSLLMLIPVVSFFFVLYLLFAPGKAEGNPY